MPIWSWGGGGVALKWADNQAAQTLQVAKEQDTKVMSAKVASDTVQNWTS